MPVTWKPEEPDPAEVARVLDRVETIIELLDERREAEAGELIEQVNRELGTSMSARAFARIPYERDTREFVVHALEMSQKPAPRADLEEDDLVELVERLRAATPRTNPVERAHWLESLAATTKVPNVAAHYDKSPCAAELRSLPAKLVVREMRAWRLPETTEDAWELARSWARHLAEGQPSLLHAAGLDLLRAALDRVTVAELEELHRLAREQRPLRLRTYMQRIGLPVGTSVPPSVRSRPPVAEAPAVEPEPKSQRRVRHAKFGEGVVVGESMRGEDVVLEIDFGGERKKLLRSFVTPVAELLVALHHRRDVGAARRQNGVEDRQRELGRHAQLRRALAPHRAHRVLSARIDRGKLLGSLEASDGLRRAPSVRERREQLRVRLVDRLSKLREPLVRRFAHRPPRLVQSPMTLAAWFAEMARNHVWSSVRLYEACARLSASDVSAARTSFFPAIDRTLWHVALVDGFYLDALTRGGRGAAIFDDHDAPPSFEAIRAAQRGFDRALLAYVATLDDPKLESLSFVDRGPRGVFPDRVGDLLLHVFQHAIHHRGQVHAMLSGTTVKPPQLDEFFLRDERPLAERELAEAGFPLI